MYSLMLPKPLKPHRPWCNGILDTPYSKTNYMIFKNTLRKQNNMSFNSEWVGKSILWDVKVFQIICHHVNIRPLT